MSASLLAGYGTLSGCLPAVLGLVSQRETHRVGGRTETLGPCPYPPLLSRSSVSLRSACLPLENLMLSGPWPQAQHAPI